jgi:endoglycosylceramidase
MRITTGWITLAVLLGAGAALSTAMSASASAGSASAVVAPEGTVVHAGRWLVDARGRVLIVHGVNVPSKTLPAYPAALGFGNADAALLASAGLNAVRITVERYAVEPTAGHFDDAYITQIADTVDMLASHGILSLIDFHQDEYGPVFHDNGFPAWMTMTDGLPNLYQVGFPGQYLLNPALERAFDHFWADDIGPDGKRLQSDDAEILSHVAGALAGQPGILGYEIMNEPWPGSVYPTCVVPAIGCPGFDKGPLSAYYDRIVPAIRAADPAHMIFYEPLSTFNQGVPTSVAPPADPRLGFAFHDYSLCGTVLETAGAPSSAQDQCAPEDSLVLSNAEAHAAATGNALLETEFGATHDTETIARQLDQYDAAMIPWMFWSYTGYVDPYAPGGTLEPPTASDINWAMLTTLARPYPQLVAGTPISWSFDPAAKVFHLVYSPDRADGHGAFAAGSETDVAVPALQYPHGYVVSVTGGTVDSQPNAPVLRILSARSDGRITVVVTPSGYAAFSNSSCPPGATPLAGGVSVYRSGTAGGAHRTEVCTSGTHLADGTVTAAFDPSTGQGYVVEDGQPSNPPLLSGYLGVDTQHTLTVVGCGGGDYKPGAPDDWTQKSTSPDNNAIASAGNGMFTAPSGPILGGPCSPQLLPWQQPDTGPGPPPGAVCGTPQDPRPATTVPGGPSPLQVYRSGPASGGDIGVAGTFGGAQGASGYLQVTYDTSGSRPSGDVTTAGQSKGGGGVVSVGDDGDQTLYPLTPPGSPLALCQD